MKALVSRGGQRILCAYMYGVHLRGMKVHGIPLLSHVPNQSLSVKKIGHMLTPPYYRCCHSVTAHVVFPLPYSGLFSWGANFHYFRGQLTSHEIFHPRILRSVTCAVQSRAD